MDRAEEIARGIYNGWTEIDTPPVLLRGRMQLNIAAALRLYRDECVKARENKWKLKYVVQRCQDLDDGFRDGRRHGFVLGMKWAKRALKAGKETV